MIGARFSIHPMTDRFVPIILGAVRELDEFPLEREGGDISTFVHGEENMLFDGLYATFATAISCPEHTVVNLTLSRGCPGEPGEDVCDPVASRGQEAKVLEGAAQPLPRVACQFSLYPMGSNGYMDAIYDEITAAGKENGLEVTPEHLCTRLDGSLDAVLGQLRTAFDRAAEVTDHVVIHAILSVNSPTARRT